jgi:hypothetical protein
MRTLTTPITDPPKISAGLDAWDLSLTRNADGSVNATLSTISATVRLYDSLGTVRGSVNFRLNGTQLTGALLTAARAYHAAVLTALQAAGKLPAGTDAQDF